MVEIRVGVRTQAETVQQALAENGVRMNAVLATLYRAIIDLAVAIQPVIPGGAGRLLDQLGVAPGNRHFKALENTDRYTDLAASGFTLAPPTPIFPRLEMRADG